MFLTLKASTWVPCGPCYDVSIASGSGSYDIVLDTVSTKDSTPSLSGGGRYVGVAKASAVVPDGAGKTTWRRCDLTPPRAAMGRTRTLPHVHCNMKCILISRRLCVKSSVHGYVCNKCRMYATFAAYYVRTLLRLQSAR